MKRSISLNKKQNARIRKQDHLNVAAEMKEVRIRMEEVQQKINEASEISGEFLGSLNPVFIALIMYLDMKNRIIHFQNLKVK